MTTASSNVLLTVEEYLAEEELSPVKHEFIAGAVYLRAEPTLVHCTIASNLIGMTAVRLREKSCMMFGSDMKFLLKRPAGSCFYYPDAMIVDDHAGFGSRWCERPRVLFEIVADSTRTVDEREKRIAYLEVPKLDAYVRIEQDERLVIVERRTANGWVQEILTEPDSILSLPTVEVELPISEFYERLEY